MKAIQYIIDNKEWIFSGIGVLVLTILYSLFFNKKRKEKSLFSNEISSPISLENSNSNTIQVINNQTNYNSEPHSDKEIIKSLREVYRLLDLSIKSVEIGLAPIKMNPSKTYSESLDEAVEDFFAFSNYYSENDILYGSEINDTISKIKNHLQTCLVKQRGIEDFKSMNLNNEIIFKESREMADLYDSSIRIEIPILREKLKEQINRQIKN